MKVAVFCLVRNCNVDRGLANCAHCQDYVCDELDALYSKWRRQGYARVADKAQANLEEIHQSLSR
jgi:hypothetical protein